jgi:hypothetical protein
MNLTDIANISLESIGGDSINSIDENTATARKIKRMVYMVIDDVSTMRNWGCLIKREKLTLAKEENGVYKFNLPNNVLNIINGSPDHNWKREGDYIYANSPEMYITYTESCYEPSKWCKNLRGAVISKLKAESVMAIVGNRDLAVSTIQLAERDINRYIMNDIYASNEAHIQKASTWYYPTV